MTADATITSEIKHPLFARFFDRFSGPLEKEIGRFRAELLEGLSGRVVEIGAGNGMNFQHYPPSVEQLVAIEPEPYLRAKATRAAETAPVPVTVSAGVADALEFEDASFDGAVACLVLCSVPDQQSALTELGRVLNERGELRFFEHVRATRQRQARVQDALDRFGIWPRLLGGCHCGRDTAAAIRAAGFSIERMRSMEVGPRWGATAPHVLGTATPLAPRTATPSA